MKISLKKAINLISLKRAIYYVQLGVFCSTYFNLVTNNIVGNEFFYVICIFTHFSTSLLPFRSRILSQYNLVIVEEQI